MVQIAFFFCFFLRAHLKEEDFWVSGSAVEPGALQICGPREVSSCPCYVPGILFFWPPRWNVRLYPSVSEFLVCLTFSCWYDFWLIFDFRA